MVMPEGSDVRGGTPTAAMEVALPRQLQPRTPDLVKLVAASFADGRTRCAPEKRAKIDVTPIDGALPGAVVGEQQKEVRQKALLSAVPPAREHLLETGLDALDSGDQHPDDLREWLEDPNARTLILAGPPGNGKSEAGYAALVHAATHGAAMRHKKSHDGGPVLVRAIEVNSYIAALRPDGSADPAWKLRDRVYNCELLLGDDLGAELDSEEMTAFMREELARLQTWRLEHKLRTIWTTNRRGPTLQTMVGSRMWSRMHEYSTQITFKGHDRRVLSKLDW
jgi:DNA replication protein DnaC